MDKKTVLEFFHNLPKSEAEQFNQAFALYMKSPGKNTATERTLNAGGYTKHNLDVLLYELQKIHGITDLEKRPPKVKPEEIVNTTAIVPSPDFGSDTITHAGPDKNQQDNQEAKDESKPIAPAFREEYPFLKDINCPDELKILAADKITFYNQYEAAHQLLQTDLNSENPTLTEEEKLNLAKQAEENFAKNEAIREEFDYYAAEGKILGKHPVFIKLQSDREVEAMTNKQLHSFVNSTKTFVSRKETAIREAQSEDKKAELQQELDYRLYKLGLVKKRLNLE